MIKSRLSVIANNRGGDGEWWLAGGITAASCIAAYQGINAMSYEASKINLANSGTYNLTEVNGAVRWDNKTGWYGFSELSRCLDTNIANAITSTCSAIVRFKDATLNNTVIIGAYDSTRGLYFSYFTATGWGFSLNSNQANVATTKSYATLAIAGIDYYVDGAVISNLLAQNAYTIVRSPYIGAQHYTTTTQYMNGSIQAAAFYSVDITTVQVAAVTAAMNAL